MHKLNLLPTEVLLNQSKKKRRLLFIFIISFLVVLLIFSIVFIKHWKICFEREIHQAYQDINDMKVNMQNQNNHEQILKDYRKRQNIHKNLTKNAINYSKILDQILLLTPKEIIVTSLRINASNNLIIAGHASSNGYVAQFMKELQTLDNINDVSLGFTHQYIEAVDGNSSGYNFEIVIGLTKDR
ncbi:MAG TPA: fimbrial assembly protein [Thermoanaerobacterales bacterium]|nr:fimbrial assembly protein [Thermoanaerobacterales bacterium]